MSVKANNAGALMMSPALQEPDAEQPAIIVVEGRSVALAELTADCRSGREEAERLGGVARDGDFHVAQLIGELREHGDVLGRCVSR